MIALSRGRSCSCRRIANPDIASRTAADAGLTNYTTFVNQTKDAANQPVNIGLHYVAAQSSALNAQPLDSDGDGVPDYVEGERGTDPNNPMSDGVTNDLYNAAYNRHSGHILTINKGCKGKEVGSVR